MSLFAAKCWPGGAKKSKCAIADPWAAEARKRQGRQNAIWGSGGFGGAVVTVNIMKRVSGKLRRTILLHFGLSNSFAIPLLENPKSHHFYGFWTWRM